MGKNMKSIGLSQIAAVLFAVLAVCKFFTFITNIFAMGVMSKFTILLWVAAFGVAAFCLWTERKDILVVSAFGVFALLALFAFFNGFRMGAYYTEDWLTGYGFSFFAMLPAFFNMVGYLGALLLTVIYATDFLTQFKMIGKKLWFVPSLFIITSLFGAVFMRVLYWVGLTGWWYGSYTYLRFGAILFRLLVTAAFCLALKILAAGEGEIVETITVNAEQTKKVQHSIPAEPEGYCGLFKHALLLVITCGIWGFIWIYKTTAFLNRVEDQPKQTPVNQLLLCMFVPCYYIYWIYTNAQKVEKFAESKGMRCEIATLSLITSLFSMMIPAIIMQEKMNEAVAGKTEHAIDETQIGLTSAAYVGLVKHTLLYLLTFGIWNFIWIYNTTKELNVVNGEEERNPVNKLLLSIFVPFYMIYWYHVSALRIDKLANAKGMKSDLATWTLILAMISPIIPAVLMQEKMNKLVN